MKGGKNYALTPVEMDEYNKSVIVDNHLYPDTGDSRNAVISGIVTVIGNDLMKERIKIDLFNIRQVKEVAMEYVQSCQRTSALPSKSGLCRSLGYSRKGVWLFMKEHPEHDTTDFLERLFDGFSEAYDIAAMGGSIHPIYAIFTQKAQFGLRDTNNQDYESHYRNPLGKVLSAEEIEEKYSYLMED